MALLEIPGAGSFRLLKPLVGFKAEIENRLARFPYDRNVFLMMKYRESNAALSRFMSEVLESHGLRGVRADQPEWNITRDVYNPLAVLYCCRYGIALFDEPEPAQAYSPNVAYELGIMHYQGKNCLILRHTSLPAPPFDLIKDLHRPYSRDLEVREAIQTWVEHITGDVAEPAVPDRPQVIPEKSGDGIMCHAVALDPEITAAQDFGVAVLTRRSLYWRLTWKVAVQNLSRGAARYRLKVVYQDEGGHSLDDQTVVTSAPIPPMQRQEFSEHYLLDHELAERLRKAVIYVARES
jgi:hypothetical protein